MEDLQEVLVLSAIRYNFEDEKSGKLIQGTNIYFVPLESTESDNVDLVGVQPLKHRLNYDQFALFEGKQLPALVSVGFKTDFRTLKMAPSTFVNFRPVGVAAVVAD